MYFLGQLLKNFPEQNDLYKQSMSIGKGTKINDKTTNLGKTGASYYLRHPT